jgi:ClpP class serine protease
LSHRSEFQTVTAGKFKRTLTPTKKVTDEDVAKAKEEIEKILTLFKAFVKENRPSLDIDKVATGETWFGNDALEVGLCDEIRTVDDVLSEYVDNGYSVYQVEYDPTSSSDSPLAGLLPIGAQSAQVKSGGVVKSMTRWLVNNIGSAIKEELANDYQSNSNSDTKDRYMVKDPRDSADRIKLEL